MYTTREEAFLLFRKWLAEDSWLLCKSDVSGKPSSMMNCRIRSVSEGEVQILEESGRLIGFIVPSTNVQFEFNEPDDFPELKENISVSMAMVTFSADRKRRDYVIFSQLINGPVTILRGKS